MKVYLIMLLLSATNIYALDNIHDLWNALISSQNNMHEENPLDCAPSLAGAKQDELWQKIALCPYEKLPLLKEDKFFEALFTSMLSNDMGTRADEISYRERLIFRHGSVAKVRLVPKKNQCYTGLFQRGAVGIIRMSLAGDPSVWGSFIPAFELKLFVDDSYSLNMLATDDIPGQESHNFFASVLSNQTPKPQTSHAKFATLILAVTKNLPDPRSSIAFAKIEDSSKLCLKHNAPRQLYFVPSDEVNCTMQEAQFQDFREDLALLEPNIILYQVMAADQHCIRAEHIADLVLESKFVSSAFCDHQLYFDF